MRPSAKVAAAALRDGDHDLDECSGPEPLGVLAQDGMQSIDAQWLQGGDRDKFRVAAEWPPAESRAGHCPEQSKTAART